MTDFCSLIRSQLAPMHPAPTYLNEWAGRQTKEQIYENLRRTRHHRLGASP